MLAPRVAVSLWLKLIEAFTAPELNWMLGVMMLPAVSLVPKRPTFSEESLPSVMPCAEGLYGSVPLDTRVPPLATVRVPDPELPQLLAVPICTVTWLLQSDPAPVTSAELFVP